MSLDNIMQCWALLALLTVGLAAGGLLTRKSAGGGASAPPKALLDFSAGQAEGRRMQKALAEALSGSATDAEFERDFKSAAGVTEGLDAESSWAWLGRLLSEYRRANEFGPSPRVLAERLLEDIPRRYRLKDVPPGPGRGA